MTDTREKEQKTWISNIQRFSLDDGPGIRTTVFLMGCSLSCQWCHNPECLSAGSGVQFHQERCIGCERCVRACPNDCHALIDGIHHFSRASCKVCFSCVERCPANSLIQTGSRMSGTEVVDRVLRDKAFNNASDGGATFSGGEALLHVDFLREALPLCKENGVHTAIDTAGNVPWTAFQAVLPHTDIFLFDVKFMSEDLHRRWTLASNRLLLENLSRLCESEKRIWLRIPVIPEVNSGDEMRKIAGLVDSLPHIERVELLPYHPYGAAKYKTLGLSYNLPDIAKPTGSFMIDQAAFFQREVMIKSS